MKTNPAQLRTQWQELTAKEPNLRIRDAALRLGVSEAELLATRVGSGVTRLAAANWADVVKELPKLGRVMCLTRNEDAVHERYGIFREIAFMGHGVGQVVGPDIDLRLFMNHWHIGFAVTDETKDGPRRSLQFFDVDGTAIHKVYLQPESNHAAYDTFVQTYRSEDQSDAQCVSPLPPGRPERPDAEIDAEGLRKGWLELKESHGFFMLLHKFGATREQALRLAPEGYAWEVDRNAAQILLEKASKDRTPIMVFIGSEGCIQIHTGEVTNIKRFGGEWINVLDDEFNMHLRDTSVVRAWVVRKPTYEGGVITSVELFDDKGKELVLFFGKRKPGQLEDPIWAALAESLPRVTPATEENAA